MSRLSFKKIREIYAWSFVSPYVVLLTIFFTIPLLMAFYLSFTDYTMLDGSLLNAKWVGVENYTRAIHDKLLLKAFLNTFIVVFVGVPIQILLALILAVLINDLLQRLKSMFKIMFFIPTLTSTVAVAIIFMFLFQSDGLVNQFTSLFGIKSINWFDNKQFAIYPIILMHAWSKIGVFMIIFIGGMQAIPDSLYESAEMDGASFYKRVLHITIPMLSPIIFFNVVVATIDAFKLFDEVFVVAGPDGGPLNSTMTVVLYLYRAAFKEFNMGYASAIAFILLFVILILTFIQRKIQGEELKM